MINEAEVAVADLGTEVGGAAEHLFEALQERWVRGGVEDVHLDLVLLQDVQDLIGDEEPGPGVGQLFQDLRGD